MICHEDSVVVLTLTNTSPKIYLCTHRIAILKMGKCTQTHTHTNTPFLGATIMKAKCISPFANNFSKGMYPTGPLQAMSK